MNKKKVKEFVKKHKKAIALSAIAGVSGGVIFAITKKKPKIDKVVEKVVDKWTDVDSSVIEMGKIEQCDTNGKWIDVVVNDINVSDLGKFGEELTKLEGVESETGVSAIISLSDEWTVKS